MPDPTVVERMRAEVERHGAAFREGLPGWRQRMEVAWREAEAAGFQGPAVAGLHRLVHSLCGTAGTFKVEPVYALSLALKHDLRDVVDGLPADGAGLRAQLGALCEALDACAPPREPPPCAS